MSKKKNLYLGKAGQFVVMSEFLVKGWNMAIPEVDIGDDIFVVKDQNGDFSRIQVKTATGQKKKYGFSAQFNIPLLQLEKVFTPDLTYVLTVRFDGKWGCFLVVKRDTPLEEYQLFNIGSTQGTQLILYVKFDGKGVSCGNRNWTRFYNNFDDWEEIDH